MQGVPVLVRSRAVRSQPFHWSVRTSIVTILHFAARRERARSSDGGILKLCDGGILKPVCDRYRNWETERHHRHQQERQEGFGSPARSVTSFRIKFGAELASNEEFSVQLTTNDFLQQPIETLEDDQSH